MLPDWPGGAYFIPILLQEKSRVGRSWTGHRPDRSQDAHIAETPHVWCSSCDRRRARWPGDVVPAGHSRPVAHLHVSGRRREYRPWPTITMTFTTWNPGQDARPAARDATCSLVGLPDVVQCIPQQTAPDRTGKGRIGARLITNADNTRRIGISPPARVAASRAAGTACRRR